MLANHQWYPVGNFLRVISQMLNTSILAISLKITNSKLHLCLPGASNGESVSMALCIHESCTAHDLGQFATESRSFSKYVYQLIVIIRHWISTHWGWVVHNMCQQMRSSLLQIMACRLLGAMPFSEPMLNYCQLNPWQQTSVKFESKYHNFHSSKLLSKCCLQNGSHFVSAAMYSNA